MKPGMPSNWEYWPLGEVGAWYGGGTPASAEPRYWDGDIPWVSPKDMKAFKLTQSIDKITPEAIQNSAAKLIPSGAVLFVTRSGILAHSFPVAVSEAAVTVNQDIKAIKPVDVIDPVYLAWALRAAERKILSSCSKHGTTVHSIEIPSLKELLVPIPPTAEQRRIVAKIEELFSELDKGVEALTTAREQLKAYRQSVLKHAFEGKLTEDWRAKNADKLETPETLLARIKHERETRYRQAFDDRRAKGSKGKTPSNWNSSSEAAEISEEELSRLPPIPDDWEFSKLTDLGELGRGKSKHRPRNDARLFGGSYPFIQTGEVKSARRYVREFSATYSEFGLSQSKLWPVGTLCITIAANIAETAFLSFPACFPDSVVGFTAFERVVSPIYIELFIKSARANIEAYAPATAQKNINLDTLQNLIVPICSLEEQAEIVRILEEKLEAADVMEAEIEAGLARAASLRQVILKRAFSGKLVPQDPNEEPASSLLARTRAERAAVPQKKRERGGVRA